MWPAQAYRHVQWQSVRGSHGNMCMHGCISCSLPRAYLPACACLHCAHEHSLHKDARAGLTSSLSTLLLASCERGSLILVSAFAASSRAKMLDTTAADCVSADSPTCTSAAVEPLVSHASLPAVDNPVLRLPFRERLGCTPLCHTVDECCSIAMY